MATTTHIELKPHEAAAIELAFVIEDPCGNDAVQLATAVVRLIANRDTATILALTHEIRALQFKYGRRNG